MTRGRMEYTKDSEGKDVLLKEGKFQVMMEWEKPYMQACIDALEPFGDVLEIGFGLGFSAQRIQSYHPKSHTIVECDPEVAAKARQWAKDYPHVTIVEDTWQRALPTLGVFDCIFFDDYPLESEEEMQQMQSQSAASHLVLEQGKKVLQQAEQAVPHLRQIRYSDADLAGLLKEIPLDSKEVSLQCAIFLKELLENGQITQMQLEAAQRALVQQKALSQQEMDAIFKSEENRKPFAFAATGDRFYRFLSACLIAHTRNGSKFSCFLSSPVSKYQDERFVQEIILNPNLDFHEEQITLDVPKTCNYFSGNVALVITITKRA